MNNLLQNQTKALIQRSWWKVGALFMQMGTGKTRVAVELINQVNDLDMVVWIAPLRTINPINSNLPSIKDEVNKWGGINAKEMLKIC